MVNELVERIQQGLFSKGFLVGAIDGIWGRRTIAALKAFQEQSGLDADGIFGPRTARKLFPLNGDAPAEPLLPWIAEAESLIGLKEEPGPASNTKIIDLADAQNIDFNSDDIPWCGLFVAHCIGATLPEEALPASPLRARNWKSFGEAIAPRRGAVMVFSRGTPDSGLGHVGFYAGETDDSFLILGGNQSDKVGVGTYPRSRLLAARWPRTAMSLNGGEAVLPFEAGTDGRFSRSIIPPPSLRH